MQILRNLLFSFLIFLIAGCARLTKSQVENIHSFAELMEKNADYSSAAISEFMNLKYEIEQINSGTFHDKAVNDKLWNSFKGREEALVKARKMDLSIKIIGEYAAALTRLSSEKIAGDVKKPSQKLGTNFDALLSEYNQISASSIPSGIGSTISEGFSVLCQGYTRKRQTLQLKKGILHGDTLIAVISDNLKKELHLLLIEKWIPVLKEELKTRQENLLANLNPTGDYKAYYATQYNKEIALLIARIDNLEQLTQKTIRSVSRIRTAHSELLKNMLEKKKLKTILTEIQALYLDTKEVYEHYEKIGNAKK
jgi:hypothetical protein